MGNLIPNSDASIAAISQATENIQTVTPEEAKRAETAALYSRYLAAQDNVKTAPAAERDAEKAYYTAAEGSDGYARRKATRDAAEAIELKKRIVAAGEKDKLRVEDALTTYAISARYADNLDSVVLVQLNEVIGMADTLQAVQSADTTNQRKTAFLVAERSTVAQWDSHMTIAVWVLALVYAKAHVLPELGNPMRWTVFGLIAASPWLIGIVGWVLDRRIPPFNAYTTFSS